MRNVLKEPLGFLCRWCLLGLAGGCVVAVLWTMVSAVSNVALGAPTWALSDAIRQPANRLYLNGFLIPRGAPLEQQEFLFSVNGGERKTVSTRLRGRLLLILDSLAPGKYEIEVIGTPYGRFAFDYHRASLTITPPGTRVYAFDAALAAAGGANENVLRACIRQAERHGRAALCSFETVEQYATKRRDMLLNYPNVPYVFYSRTTAGRLDTLYHLIHAMGGKNLMFITADEQLAIEAAYRHRTLPVRLVDSARPSEDRRENPIRFSSPAAFLESLNTSPNADRPIR